MSNPGDHSFPTSEGPGTPGPLGDSPIDEGKKVIVGDEFEDLRYENYRNLLNIARWDRRHRMATLNGKDGMMDRMAQFVKGWNVKLRILAHMHASKRFKW